MLKTSVSVLATVAVLTAGSALAQDSTTTDPQVLPPATSDGTGTDTTGGMQLNDPSATTAPAPDAGMGATGGDTAQGSPDMPATGTEPLQGTAEMPATGADPLQGTAEMPATGTDSATVATTTATEPFVQMQQQGQWLASDLIGAKVRSANDEDLGEVNDVLFTQNGVGEAIVVGVGGFLGIGEKDVAIPFERLTVVDEEGEGDDLMVSLETTKEELESAPTFQTLDDVDATMTSTTTTEGVTPPTGATDPVIEEPIDATPNATTIEPEVEVETVPSTNQ